MHLAEWRICARTAGRALSGAGSIALQVPGSTRRNFPDDYVRAALDTCKGKFRIFSELPAYCGFYFADEVTYPAEGVAKHFIPENKPRLQALRDAFDELEIF